MIYKKVVSNFMTSEKLEPLFEKWGQTTGNPFVKAVGDKILEKYSRFCRSFDSKLGNFLKDLAQSIVREKFKCLSEKEIKAIENECSKKPNLCFLKGNVWNVIELKSGGLLDSTRGSDERKKLDVLKSIISKQKGETKIYFATAYKNGKGAENFSKNELLLGEDFWEFICEDKNSYQFILKSFRDQIKLILKKKGKGGFFKSLLFLISSK